MWKKLGKEGFAVKAPWPVAGEEDKSLTRQSKFLRDSLKKFRTQVGKAKKGATKATIIVSDNYPQWKIDTLEWMQAQYEANNSSFPKEFMKDLKTWTGEKFATDKKQIKFAMQFVSFQKNEVNDVGPSAMETTMPFDQASILEGSLTYMKSQLILPELDIMKVGDSADIPDRIVEQVTPGKPSLWLR